MVNIINSRKLGDILRITLTFACVLKVFGQISTLKIRNSYMESNNSSFKWLQDNEKIIKHNRICVVP